MSPPAFPFPEAPAEGLLLQVAPGVHWVRLPLPMALDHVNIYVLDDGAGWTVVDTGLSSGRGRALWQALLDGPLAAKPVTRVLVTHHHPDHVGLAGWLMERTGAELLMSRTAWLYARMLVLDEHALPPPEQMNFWQRAGLTPDAIAERADKRPFNFCDVVHPLPPGFGRLQEGQVLQAAGRDWQVHFGQGHAPDQVVLVAVDGSLILGADQLLPTITPNIGVYPTEPEADPLTEFLASCHRFAALDRGQLVLPGHKLPFTGLAGRMDHLIRHHEGTLARLRDHLAHPAVTADCLLPVFQRQIGPEVHGLALAETLAHLNCLLQRGQISRTLSDQGAWVWRRE